MEEIETNISLDDEQPGDKKTIHGLFTFPQHGFIVREDAYEGMIAKQARLDSIELKATGYKGGVRDDSENTNPDDSSKGHGELCELSTDDEMPKLEYCTDSKNDFDRYPDFDRFPIYSVDSNPDNSSKDHGELCELSTDDEMPKLDYNSYYEDDDSNDHYPN